MSNSFVDRNFNKNNDLDLKILKFEDKKNYIYYFKKYWNSFVNSDTPKVYFTLKEFLKKVNDEEYLKKVIKNMEYQNRIASCQYIKDDKKTDGFANYFFVYLPKEQGPCCHSHYYFIYKNEFIEVKDPKKEIFIPNRQTYMTFNINLNSLDYLANFAIPIQKNDKIYCLKCKKILERNEILQNKVINLNK